MKNLHRVAFVLLLLGGALIGQAQTVNDSLAIVSAQWEVKTIGKGIVSRCAAFQELYHGPQYVSIIEVNPKQRHRAGIAFSRECVYVPFGFIVASGFGRGYCKGACRYASLSVKTCVAGKSDGATYKIYEGD